MCKLVLVEKYSARIKIILVVFINLILLTWLLFYLTKFIEPSSPVKNLIISNLSDSQASISWTTDKPTKGIIMVSENENFPWLPIFAKEVWKDDGEKLTGKIGFYTTHHITVEKLKSKQTYQFRIYQGWKRVYQGSFTTGSILSTLTSPNPVYGEVFQNDRKTPAVGAIIYLSVSEASGSSSLLSTLTNQDGRWSLDLGNLKTADLVNPYLVTDQTTEQILVEAADLGKFQAQTTISQDKPWPDIILEKQ